MNNKSTITVCFQAYALAGFVLPASAEEPRSWNCERNAIFVPSVQAEVKKISSKPSMINVIEEHMKRWDATEMRRQCEAYANGQAYEISCLNGRRDWGAIANSIPDDLVNLSAASHRDHLLKIQEEGNGFLEASKYCQEVGAT